MAEGQACAKALQRKNGLFECFQGLQLLIWKMRSLAVDPPNSHCGIISK